MQPIPLEVILLHPYFWNSDKICDFFRDVLKLVRDHEEGNDKETKEKMQNFMCQLDDLGSKHQILDSEWEKFRVHWDKYLAFKYFQAKSLPSNESEEKLRVGKKKPKTDRVLVDDIVASRLVYKESELQSISFIMKQIRDKYEHSGNIPHRYRLDLGWFDQKGYLDSHLFIGYWTSCFPQLLPFVWLQFHEYRNVPAITKYYPADLHFPDNIPIRFEDMLGKLDDAFEENLKTGGLQKRYVTPDPNHLTLEVRTTKSETLKQILSSFSTIIISVLPDKFTITWCVFDRGKERERSLEYKVNPINPTETSDNKETILVISNDDISNISFSSYLKKGSGTKLKVTLRFITSSSNLNFRGVLRKIEKCTGAKFCENPLIYSELSPELQDKITSCTIVQLPYHQTSLELILPKSIEVRSSWFASLNGPVLNELLQENQLSLGLKYQKIKETYVLVHNQLKTNSFNLQVKVCVDESAVIIAVNDVSTFAKCAILQSCATLLTKSNNYTYVISVEMCEFAKQLGKQFCDKMFQPLNLSDIEKVILDLCTCSGAFERNVVGFWLRQSRASNRFNVEIILNNFDYIFTVPEYIAKNICKAICRIQQQMPAVRLWFATKNVQTVVKLGISCPEVIGPEYIQQILVAKCDTITTDGEEIYTKQSYIYHTGDFGDFFNAINSEACKRGVVPDTKEIIEKTFAKREDDFGKMWVWSSWWNLSKILETKFVPEMLAVKNI